MGEETTKKKRHSVGIAALVGIILVTLLVGMIVGGVLSFLVVAPFIEKIQGNNQGTNNQNTQNNNNQNSNPTQGNSNNNNYNNQGSTSSPYNNNQNGNTNQGPTGSPNSNNNNNSNSQGMTNNNPPITNPTGQYNSMGSQFSVSAPNQNGGKDSGTISADVICAVQQSGNNIQLDLTLTLTNVPQSLSQDIQNAQVIFNFAGTTSGSQINAQASGNGGSDSSSPNFDLNLSGSMGSNSLTLSITAASDSQISISTQHSITLQNS